jgi:hypothetical protein
MPQPTKKQEPVLRLLAAGHTLRFSSGYWLIEESPTARTYARMDTLNALVGRGWITLTGVDDRDQRYEITAAGRAAIGEKGARATPAPTPTKRIKVTSNPQPRIRDTGRSQPRVAREVVARALGADAPLLPITVPALPSKASGEPAIIGEPFPVPMTMHIDAKLRQLINMSLRHHYTGHFQPLPIGESPPELLAAIERAKKFTSYPVLVALCPDGRLVLVGVALAGRHAKPEVAPDDRPRQ